MHNICKAVTITGHRRRLVFYNIRLIATICLWNIARDFCLDLFNFVLLLWATKVIQNWKDQGKNHGQYFKGTAIPAVLIIINSDHIAWSDIGHRPIHITTYKAMHYSQHWTPVRDYCLTPSVRPAVFCSRLGNSSQWQMKWLITWHTWPYRTFTTTRSAKVLGKLGHWNGDKWKGNLQAEFHQTWTALSSRPTQPPALSGTGKERKGRVVI